MDGRPATVDAPRARNANAAREGGIIEGQGCAAALFPVGAKRMRYAVSPYTVTLISTTTSVCRATPTVDSPTILIGPAGMRTCDLCTL